MIQPKYQYFDCLGSTNTYLRDMGEDAQDGLVIVAREQNAGRGQRGNSWEAEPQKNATFSMLVCPDVEARRQFVISEAVSLALVSVLDGYGIKACIKWPNDIYVGDKKICGILIEHAVMNSKVTRTVIGVGLNVNQETFVSDAPNPVSMKQLTGKEYSVEEVIERLAEDIAARMVKLDSPTMHEEYMREMWRNDGYYDYVDVTRGESIEAKIENVEPMGHLCLRLRDGELRRYAFKEVTAIL